jgi:hypothetical protein
MFFWFFFLSFCIWLYVLYTFVKFCKLCNLIVMFTYSYCLYALFCIFCFHRANCHSLTTLTEVFLCFFLSCKANARVYLAKTGRSSHSSKLVNCVVLCIVCVDYVVLCIIVCINVYCTTATGWQPNCSWICHIISLPSNLYFHLPNSLFYSGLHFSLEHTAISNLHFVDVTETNSLVFSVLLNDAINC